MKIMNRKTISRRKIAGFIHYECGLSDFGRRI